MLFRSGDVYLFSGDEFGIALTITGDEIDAINYKKDPKKADVAFRFSQQVDEDKRNAMMMCRIINNTKHRLFFDGLMTIPEKEGIFRTSIIPLEPKLTNYESWPHPIVQLVLRNIRLKDKAPTDEGQTKTEQGGSRRPATRSESDSDGGDKPQPESEGRSR